VQVPDADHRRAAQRLQRSTYEQTTVRCWCSCDRDGQTRRTERIFGLWKTGVGIGDAGPELNASPFFLASNGTTRWTSRRASSGVHPFTEAERHQYMVVYPRTMTEKTSEPSRARAARRRSTEKTALGERQFASLESSVIVAEPAGAIGARSNSLVRDSSSATRTHFSRELVELPGKTSVLDDVAVLRPAPPAQGEQLGASRPRDLELEPVRHRARASGPFTVRKPRSSLTRTRTTRSDRAGNQRPLGEHQQRPVTRTSLPRLPNPKARYTTRSGRTNSTKSGSA
jgi:hypothetical protein